MNEVYLSTEIDRALQIYNTASPHIKKRESMRLLGVLAKALVQMREDSEMNNENELITKEWLTTVGFLDPEGDGCFSFSGLYLEKFSSGWRWQVGGHDNCYEHLATPTRGTIVQLLAAMGVKLPS